MRKPVLRQAGPSLRRGRRVRPETNGLRVGMRIRTSRLCSRGPLRSRKCSRRNSRLPDSRELRGRLCPEQTIQGQLSPVPAALRRLRRTRSSGQMAAVHFPAQILLMEEQRIRVERRLRKPLAGTPPGSPRRTRLSSSTA